MNNSELKEWYQQCFRDVIEDLHADEAVIARYFSPQYKQYVDGHELDYQGFVAHMRAQKQVLKSIQIKFLHIIAEGNKICSVHEAHAIKKDGQAIKVKVVAYCEVEAGKLVLVDELTHMLAGKPEDRDIGSRK